MTIIVHEGTSFVHGGTSFSSSFDDFLIFCLEICQIWEQSFLNRPVWESPTSSASRTSRASSASRISRASSASRTSRATSTPPRVTGVFVLQSLGFFLTRAPSAFDPEVAACYELALVLRDFHLGE